MERLSFILAICLSITLLCACAPSTSQIEAAIAKTQAAWTSTPTLIPPPTAYPTADDQQTQKTVDSILAEMATFIETYDTDVDSVTTIRPGTDFA